jgi:hypothetical protein
MPDQSPYLPDPHFSGGQYPYPQRRGPSWLLIAGVVMLVIAIGVGGYVVYNNRAVLFPPIVPTPVSTSRPTNDALALATTTPPLPTTAPSPSGAAPASPTASPAPTEAIPATLFAALAVAPNASFHADVVVTVKAQVEGKMTLTLSMDQSGTDLDGTMVLRYRHQKVNVRIIVKDGKYYGKVNRTAWQLEPTPPTDDFGTLLAPGSAQNVQDLGVENRDGKALHHLQADFTQGPEMSGMASEAGCDTADSVADFWVRDDGTPVSAQFDYSCAISGDNMTGHATYEFSEFGQPIVIQVPKKFR